MKALLVSCLVLSSINVTAEDKKNASDSEPESWYHVELLVFRYLVSPSEDQTENWPSDIQLAYPDNLVQLKKGPGYRVNPMATSNKLELVPFEEVIVQELSLQNAKQKMEDSTEYRTLYHHQWRQPIGDKLSTPHIEILGGQQYGDFHELSGSIQFHKNRYLHVSSNLWLTNFQANTGSSDNPWPIIPLSHNRSKVDPSTFMNTDKNSTAGLNKYQTQTELFEYDDLIKYPYTARRIVLLQQNRRMRSSETHYVDHPVFGFIVKLIPIDIKEPEDKDAKQAALRTEASSPARPKLD